MAYFGDFLSGQLRPALALGGGDCDRPWRACGRGQWHLGRGRQDRRLYRHAGHGHGALCDCAVAFGWAAGGGRAGSFVLSTQRQVRFWPANHRLLRHGDQPCDVAGVGIHSRGAVSLRHRRQPKGGRAERHSHPQIRCRGLCRLGHAFGPRGGVAGVKAAHRSGLGGAGVSAARLGWSVSGLDHHQAGAGQRLGHHHRGDHSGGWHLGHSTIRRLVLGRAAVQRLYAADRNRHRRIRTTQKRRCAQVIIIKREDDTCKNGSF